MQGEFNLEGKTIRYIKDIDEMHNTVYHFSTYNDLHTFLDILLYYHVNDRNRFLQILFNYGIKFNFKRYAMSYNEDNLHISLSYFDDGVPRCYTVNI